MRVSCLAAVATAVLGLAGSASVLADTTVECRSVDYRYNECSARGMSSPQLIYQISSSSCILNRTWGFNPNRGYLWVAEGCSGRFGESSGYHHGRGDTWDEGARHYSSRGEDVGVVVGGLVLGAVLGAVLSGGNDEPPRTQSHGRRDAPPEPGQLELRRQGGDAPPEPGQLEFRR
ncbi:MAG: hypothetical protein BGO13_15455 [Burkholderiales bacterium 66-5]|nr:MAG: hypothetical protein BGO13_15455 [Burkholderiales bacterium 66-5]